MTVWGILDLQALLARERGSAVNVAPVQRAVYDLGFRSRPPRDDLTHRQDREAMAAATHVLDWLPQKRLLSPEDSIWSAWTNAQCTPTHTWLRSGAARGTS